jgi:hypothetical protein
MPNISPVAAVKSPTLNDLQPGAMRNGRANRQSCQK